MPVKRQTPADEAANLCPRCDGAGYEISRIWRLLGREVTTRVLCRRCNGSGTKTPDPPPDKIR